MLSQKEIDWLNHRIRGLEIRLSALTVHLLSTAAYFSLRADIKEHEAKWGYDSEGNKK